MVIYGVILPIYIPSLDDGDDQCHLHLQLFVVYHSLLSEVHVKLNFDHSNSMNTETYPIYHWTLITHKHGA